MLTLHGLEATLLLLDFEQSVGKTIYFKKDMYIFFIEKNVCYQDLTIIKTADLTPILKQIVKDIKNVNHKQLKDRTANVRF